MFLLLVYSIVRVEEKKAKQNMIFLAVGVVINPNGDPLSFNNKPNIVEYVLYQCEKLDGSCKKHQEIKTEETKWNRGQKKTYNSRYSLVVTHPTTNLPI
jgi:hypothetical protein